MARLIQQNPGISVGDLARRLRVERNTVARRLPSLEEIGILLAEDEHGRLWFVEERRA
jgi:DNA-binding IclR family transcriptional regulator